MLNWQFRQANRKANGVKRPQIEFNTNFAKPSPEACKAKAHGAGAGGGGGGEGLSGGGVRAKLL